MIDYNQTHQLDYTIAATAKTKGYLLLDFCSLQEIKKEVFDVLTKIARLSAPNLKMVVAFSSGEGRDAFCRGHISTLSGSCVKMKGFTENEVKKYLTVNKCGKEFGGGDDDHSFELIKSHCI